MKREPSAYRSWFRTGGLALLLFAFVAILSAIPLISDWEARFVDTFFRLAPAPASNARVVLVTIDDESLQRFGRWPWSRVLVAQMMNNLARAGASAIGIDILFA